jgi:hypothetical protein
MNKRLALLALSSLLITALGISSPALAATFTQTTQADFLAGSFSGNINSAPIPGSIQIANQTTTSLAAGQSMTLSYDQPHSVTLNQPYGTIKLK